MLNNIKIKSTCSTSKLKKCKMSLSKAVAILYGNKILKAKAKSSNDIISWELVRKKHNVYHKLNITSY